MKCPKCGYNSFDHLDSCKKCGKDLLEHKQRFGIVSVLFPGQMTPVGMAARTEEDSAVVDAVVAAATVTAATTVVAAVADPVADEPAEAAASDGDDFGFDFMGDSEEEEDLSFDELFEEAPADEDVEETLPGPEDEETVSAAAENAAADEFTFDPTEDDAAGEGFAAASELEDDFGFDPVDEPAAVLETDDFELPPAAKDNFSFEADSVEFKGDEKEDGGTGSKEDPKDPFDLPEFSLYEKAPEQDQNHSGADFESADIEEDDLLLSSPFTATAVAEELEIPSALGAEVSAVTATEAGAVAGDELLAVGADLSSADSKELPPEQVSAAPVQKLGSLAEVAPTVAVVGAATFTEAMIPDDLAAKEILVAEQTAAKLETGALPATGSRIAAFCCDLLLLLLVGISFVIAAEAAISTTGDSLLPSLETLIDLSVPYFLVLFSLAFGYFTLFHFLAGQTPGKMLAGLRVETVGGEPLLFSQAFLRSVGGLLQLLPVGFGYLAILSSPERRGWNDRLAGTRLVSLNGLSEEV